MVTMTRATNMSSTAAITEDWKISDVLQAHPALLDVLVETTPAFRVRNRSFAKSRANW
ncbi:MAG: hypothetical protein R2839_11675 [Thermomicrobiales bacterium]